VVVVDMSLHGRLQMHDVAVAADVHELHDLHRPRLADPAQVVAAEIHQHHMLGTFLRIGQQLGLQRGVLGGRRPTGFRTGDRVRHRDAVLNGHQCLRAGPDDVESSPAVILEPEEVHVRARVGQPQDAVNVQGIGSSVHLEPLADDDLKGLAGTDLFHRGSDGALELRSRALSTDRKRAVEAGRGRRGRCRSSQSLGHGVDPGDGVGVRLVHPLVGRIEVDRVRDQPHLAVVVVEHRQVGGEQKRQFRDLEVSRVGVGQSFHSTDCVIAEIADQAGRERRETVDRWRMQDAECVGQGGEGVATGGQTDRGVAQPARIPVRFGQGGCRTYPDEGVTRPHALLRGLEQVRARGVGRQFGIEADRGLGVGKEAAIDGYDATFDGELAEILQRGSQFADHAQASIRRRRCASKQVRSPV
jgi:hypothetical protein